MKEDRLSCARLRRGAGFSHRGRGAPLSAPDAPTVKASVLYTPLSETVRKSCLCRRLGEGVASGRHHLRPAKIHGPSEKHLGLTRGELARERLKHGICPTHAKRTRLSRLPRPEASVERNRMPPGRIPLTDDRCGLRRPRQTGRRDAEQT
jgi:hypothetical protein